jgi:hypothetical protein
MLLPTAYCPNCRRDAVVYRDVAPDGDPLTAELETRCVDCDTRLDRFGTQPDLTERDLSELRTLGYKDLDRPNPLGRGGCFETTGCVGCPKIDTRPW